MDGVDKNSRNGEESKEVMKNEESGGVKEAERKSSDEVVVEINDDDGRSRNGESSKSEVLCRICHFVDEESSGDSQLIALGCDCRGDLGVSHRGCAAAWFSLKGNRECEICGKTAKNIIINNSSYEGDSAILMMNMNEMRLVIEALDSSNESSRRCKISFCNFLLLCLLLAFFLPWFFRGFDML